MHPFLTATSLLSLGALVRAAVLPRQSQSLPFPDEVVYLSNCVDNGMESSELDYYSEFITARAGGVPDEDNVSLVNAITFANWVGLVGQAPHIFSSGALFFLDSLSTVQVGQQAGSANNDDGTQFTCFQESNQLLFTSGSKECYAQWSCSHINTVEFHQTNSSIGIIPVSVTQTGSEDSSFVGNVFGNVMTAIQNGGGESCDGSFSFGDGFSIAFTCSASDSGSLSALGQFVQTMFPFAVNITSTPEQPPTCKGTPICEMQEGSLIACCNNQPATTTYTFPQHGVAQVDLIDNANVDGSSIQQTSISYEITSPPNSDGGCDSNFCQFFQGAIQSQLDAVTDALEPEVAFLGILLGATCLFCAES